MTVQISCLHAHGISDLPMGNVPGLQQVFLGTHRSISREIVKRGEGQSVRAVVNLTSAAAWKFGHC